MYLIRKSGMVLCLSSGFICFSKSQGGVFDLEYNVCLYVWKYCVSTYIHLYANVRTK